MRFGHGQIVVHIILCLLVLCELTLDKIFSINYFRKFIVNRYKFQGRRGGGLLPEHFWRACSLLLRIGLILG